MKKTIFFILFVATCIYSQDFLPLKTGNRWDFKYYLYQYPNPYVVLNPYSIKVFADSVFKNSKKYYGITNFKKYFSYYHNLNDTSWIRVENGYVFMIDYQTSTEKVILNFNMSVGDTLTINHTPLQWIGLVSNTSKLYLNIYSQCLDYYVDLAIDITRRVYFSKKLGIVEGREIYFPPEYHSILSGCVINDTIYGTLLGIANDYSGIKKIELQQNYPNPFNPSTEIKYSIKEKGLVTIKIYDIFGNVVKTLIEENKEAGNYSVTFNASNFSSGIYFYELTVMNGSQPFRATKKMMILK